MKTRLLFLNQCFDKTRLRNLIAWVLYTKGEKRTIEIVEKLKSLGFQFATRAGISLSVDDLRIPSEKGPLVSQAKQQVALADREYERGSVTSIEKLQQLVDTWHRTSETLKQTVVSNFQATDKLSPVYMMAFSGARGNISQVRQLAGMRGLMADPQGQIIGFPIRSNFREGLTLTEYMISCYGARKGLVDTALRTADAGYLTRRLVDVSQHMVVKASTCATRRGILLYDLVISGKSALSLRDRLIGRVLAQDVYLTTASPAQKLSISPKNLQHFSSLKGSAREAVASPSVMPLVGKRNQEISASLASQIASLQKSISVRSPLTCSIRDGVCQLCYGWSLSEGRLVNLGEAVGIIAAQSIGEPGTQLTMRTFHTGGVFSGDVMTEIRSPYEGTAHFNNPLQGLLIRTSHGKIAFLTKSPGELVIQSNKILGGVPSMGHHPDNEQTLFTLAASTVVFIRHHEQVSRAQLIAEFSSMGTEINETIEAKRTLFANNAGQISFASLLIGTQRRGNGEIVRVSRDLGFVWILSGRQPGPAALLEILQRGAHIVNQNTIIARVSAFSPKVYTIEKMKTTRAIFGGGKPNPPLKEPLRLNKGARTIVFDGVVGGHRTPNPKRFVNGDGKQFLPSILYSLIPVTSTKFALVKRDQTDERVLPALYRSIPSANTPTLLGSDARLTLKTSAQQPRAEGVADTATHLGPSLPSQRWYQPALSTQRHASSYSLPSSVKKGINFVERNPDNVLVWVFPTRYKVTKKGMVWFDSRCLSQKLTFGELLLIDKNIASLCHGNTISPVVTSCYKTISAKRRFGEQTFLPVKIISANPLADQPSISNDKNSWDQGAERLMCHHLQCLQAPSLHFVNKMDKARGGQRTPTQSLQAFQNEDNQANFKSYSNYNAVSPFKEASDNYSVTSSKFPHLFAKASKISNFSFNKGKEVSFGNTGRGFDGHSLVGRGWPSNPLAHKDPKTKDEKSNRQAVSDNSPTFASRFALGGITDDEATASRIRDGVVGGAFTIVSNAKTPRGIKDGEASASRTPTPITPKRLFHCNKLAATKSWIVNFENNYSFTKKKALKLQSEHFLYHRQRGVLHSSREESDLGGFNRGNMANSVGGTAEGEATASRITDGVRDPSTTQEASTSLRFVNKKEKASPIAYNAFPDPKNPIPKNFQTNNIVLDSLTKIYHRAKTLNDRLGFEGTREKKDGQKSSRSFIKVVRTSNKDTSLSSVKELHTVTISSSIGAPLRSSVFVKNGKGVAIEPPICPKDVGTRQSPRLEGDTTQPIHNSLGSLCAKGARPQKHSSFWVYCPQEIHKVSVLHESVDFYRNWQFDNLCFDSSLTYIKGLFSSELLYQVKNNLDPIVSKLFLLSKRKTELCKSTGLLLTQPLRTEMGGGRMLSLQPYSIFQPLSRSNRHYLSVYRSLNSGAEDVSLSSVKKRSVKFLLHFAGPNMVDSLKGEGYTFSDPTLSSRKTFLPLLTLKKDVLFFLRKWMQIPQSCALHEGLIYLNKWDNASSLSKVLQIEQTTTQTVKISAPCHGDKGFKLFFDTHSCFQSINCTEDHSTKRYRLLVWKNLMNCKPFLLLRACPLQVQIVSNTKARNFLPISVAHPLSWQSLVHLRKANLQASSRSAWYKESRKASNLRFEGAEANGAQDSLRSVKDTIFSRKVKDSLYKLNLRQRLGFGPLPLKIEEEGSFFDSISNLETEALTNRVSHITKVQHRETCWPYSSQPTIFAVASKGCSILLPSNIVATEKGGSNFPWESRKYYLSVDSRSSRVVRAPIQNPKSLGLLGSSIAKSSRGGSLSANPKTKLFRFVTKVKKTLLVTNCKPTHLSLMPLLLSREFCTRVVSNESYLIRFFGNISSSLTSLDSATRVSSNDQASSKHQLSPAMGEIVSQDTDFRFVGGFADGEATASRIADGVVGGAFTIASNAKIQGRLLLGSAPLQPYVKSLNPQGFDGHPWPAKGVLLTEGDQLSMSISGENTNVSVGQFVTLGEEFVPGYAALVSGQVVAIEQNKITLRRTQALLFYAQGVTHVNHGQWVNKNAPILTLTYQKLVTGDIVQGIPKIEQFFEAPATREGEPLANSLQLRLRRTYQRLKSLLPLAEAVKQSLEEIQQVLVEGILRVYLSQGVRIADKHLEIVIRQMTSKGQVIDVGDTGLFQGEFVNLNRIERINLGTYGQKADYEPSVLGITQASLGSESFISAASFQETTRVLSRDTIMGKTDFLRGLKERVVLGDVIQAGTGLDDNINYGLLFGVTSS